MKIQNILAASILAINMFTLVSARQVGSAQVVPAPAVSEAAPQSGWNLNQIRSEHRRQNAAKGDAATLCSDLCNKQTCRDPNQASRCVVACRAAMYKKNPDGSYKIDARGKHVKVRPHQKTAFGTEMNTKGINRAYNDCKGALAKVGKQVPDFVSTTMRTQSTRADLPVRGTEDPSYSEPVAPMRPAEDKSFDARDDDALGSQDQSAYDSRGTVSESSAAVSGGADSRDAVASHAGGDDRPATTDFNAPARDAVNMPVEKPAPAAAKPTPVEKQESWLGGWFGTAKPPEENKGSKAPESPAPVTRTNDVINYDQVSDLARKFATKANAMAGREGDRAIAVAIILEHMVHAVQNARKAEGVRSTAVLNSANAEMERTIRKLQEQFMHANPEEQKMLAAVINVLSGVDKIMDSSKD